MAILELPTPQWALPFLEPMRYKGLKGGRSGGKSHFFGEAAVETMVLEPSTDFVCIREVQKSLKYSAKKLIEGKIERFRVGYSFDILETEIRRIGSWGQKLGVMIFQGMQDHTSDSIKSLEDFNRAWFEEAQRMSNRSLELLIPTFRADDSEIWFSWNPDQETDPIEKFFATDMPDEAVVAHVNFTDNPFCPEVSKKDARLWMKRNPDSYAHVWEGQYNTKSDDQVLAGKWEVDEFEVQDHWDGPYYGADWGFSVDPIALVEVFIDQAANRIYIRRELCKVGVEINDTPDFFRQMTGCDQYTIRADSARPELISHMRKEGKFHKMIAAEKWPGSVEDGITWLRSCDRIVVHTDCPQTALECRLYKYKRDRLTDDILPELIKKHDHLIDALRYSIEPLTKRKPKSFWDR